MTDEESVYETSVPEIPRLMIDLPQNSDDVYDEASVSSEFEVDSKPKSDVKAKIECGPELGENTPSVKRKSGWPKGKKRKPLNDTSDMPKAPTTGYVLFLKERRDIYKSSYPELSFPEVTKLLGGEWSSLSQSEKQKYLDQADADKKRYREELRSYEQSERDPDGADITKPKQISLENQESISGSEKLQDSLNLYCNVCNQFFISLHNKKEHFYGKQHLQAVTWSTRTDGNSAMHMTLNNLQPSNIDQSILDFIEVAISRDAEVKELGVQLVKSKDRNGSLLRELGQLRALNSRLQGNMQRLKTEETCLKEQLHNLRMVPTLFGVIHFQH